MTVQEDSVLFDEDIDVEDDFQESISFIDPVQELAEETSNNCDLTVGVDDDGTGNEQDDCELVLTHYTEMDYTVGGQ